MIDLSLRRAAYALAIGLRRPPLLYVDFSRMDMYIVHMNGVRFEWDERKNRVNRKKHGVSFEEAQTVFFDENALRFSDPDHSEDEDRFIMLGMSSQLKVLVVCHCCRVEETVIRIISARKADKTEERYYRR